MRVAVPVLLLTLMLVGASTAGAASTRASAEAVCSSYGPMWLASYNKQAQKQGNPIRIVSACCHPTKVRGINHCFVEVTLVNTPDRGCESVDIGRNGLPAGPGKHENCLVRATRQQVA
jgi:hypothetical protein